jgi:NAD(P)-dependent dehydrogenase (short-subunit alcohol dehydrogenase family)
MSNSYTCVTGADRGLGYALTAQLLRRHFTVFAGRYLNDWDQLDGLTAQYPKQLIPLELDVSSDDSVNRFGAAVAERTDRLEIVINNAGVAGDLEQNIYNRMNTVNMLSMFNVNSLGPLRITVAVAPLLLRGESKLLVNISSEAGQINQTWREGWYGYCMSKAALNIQSNIVHNELKSKGGRVLVIHPGWMRTYMSGKLSEEGDLSAEEAAAHIAETVLRYRYVKEIHAHPVFLDYKGDEMRW